jgi:type II secretory pathway pseudopilin PulG
MGVKMKKQQLGFSVVEGLLITIIIGILGGVGWYVWQRQKQVDTTYLQTANSSVSPKTKNKGVATNQATSANGLPNSEDVNYNPAIVITSASDVTKLENSTQAFKDFVAEQINTLSASEGANACTKPTLTISKIIKQKYSLGDVTACNSDSQLWVFTGNKWQKVDEQTKFSCSIINKYSVPKTLISKCVDSQSQYIDNSTS